MGNVLGFLEEVWSVIQSIPAAFWNNYGYDIISQCRCRRRRATRWD